MTGNCSLDVVELSTDDGREVRVAAVHWLGSPNPLLAARQLHEGLGLAPSWPTAQEQLKWLPGSRLSETMETKLLRAQEGAPAMRSVLLITLDAAIQWLTSLDHVEAATQLSRYKKRLQQPQRLRQQREPRVLRLLPIPDSLAVPSAAVSHPVCQLESPWDAACRRAF